jgi:hypothetical protein
LAGLRGPLVYKVSKAYKVQPAMGPRVYKARWAYKVYKVLKEFKV